MTSSSVVEAWTYLACGLVVTALRTYSRITQVGFRSLQPDDYLVWVAAIFYAIETAASYSVGAVAHGFANNGLSNDERSSLPPESTEYHLRQAENPARELNAIYSHIDRVIGSKIQLIGWSTYTVLLWALKTSYLFFYLRLTTGLMRGHRILIYIGFILIPVSWLILILIIFLGCRPFHYNWQIYPDPGNACYPAVSRQLLIGSLVLNVVTDLYLITIPVVILWRSTLRLAKKIGLIILFSGGFLVIACAILRSVLMLTDPINGAQTAGSWSVRETFIATITTNLPVVFPLFKRWLGPVFSNLFTSIKSGRTPPKDPSYDIHTSSNGFKGFRGPKRNYGNTPTADTITNFTFTESEEHIVDNIQMQTYDSTGFNTGRSPSPGNRYTGIRKDVEVRVSSESLEHQAKKADNYTNNSIHTAYRSRSFPRVPK
ncbi:hypothetical protein F4805DRAFT_340068 [Annulohypoxylon moriforme]|nr:hypothetical protein F4805DRAFT_340068 [Annulohypoxylon moriforme]